MAAKPISEGYHRMMPPKNQFDDRNTGIKDFFGHQSCLAARVEDLTKEKIDQHAEAYYEAHSK